ncbi:MAG TPA: GNAT family N-acetyltransferase [Planctomycetota bacterium]|nr:GNAT family N-acetyltransferase [Planctomycetota bacterium]
MRFLIDTNILIALEPAGNPALHANTDRAAELLSLVHAGGHTPMLHPASHVDIGRDQDPTRREQVARLATKYAPLSMPPRPSAQMITAMGGPFDENSNDWVDCQILSAVALNAVDFLVTEDHGIHRKARRVGIADRVGSIQDVIALLQALLPRIRTAPPAVNARPCYSVDESDPLFDTLRRDYHGFDEWYKRCKLAGRPCWTIEDARGLCGFAMVKPETDPVGITLGRALKVCTFKVAERAAGNRFGELLLKPIFDYAFANGHSHIYLTTRPGNAALVAFMADFGFQQVDARADGGDIVLLKRTVPSTDDTEANDPLSFHIKFGPPRVHPNAASAAVVPIRPEYADLLFPETSPELPLFAGVAACGNALKKAYVSRTKTRSLAAGDLLLFYRSGDVRGAVAVGVVEETRVFSDADDALLWTGKRTVYSRDDLAQMLPSAIFVIKFRQTRALAKPIPLDELCARGLVSAPPQSLVRVPALSIQWLRNLTNASY